MQSAAGSIGRVIALRMAPGEDILLGLQQVCKEHNLNNGIILSGIGSLNGARFCDPICLPEKKAGYGYSDPIVMNGPVELLSAAGMICQGVDGETLFHVHLSLSDQNGGGWGGHLIEGNKVLLTADFVIGELNGLCMGRRWDTDLETFIFNPTTM